MVASSRGETSSAPYTTSRPSAPRSTKSRDYFTGAFGGSSTFQTGSSPPEKDIWGSATKKGSFDENGKFVVSEDDQLAQPLELENTLEDNATNEFTTGDFGEDLNDLPPPPPTKTFSPETSDSPTQFTDGFSLPATGGRAPSRFPSFGLSEDLPAEDDPRMPPESRPPPFADDPEDDV